MNKNQVKETVQQINNLKQDTYLQDVTYYNRFTSMQGGQATPFQSAPDSDELFNLAEEVLFHLSLINVPTSDPLFRAVDALAEGLGKQKAPLALALEVLDRAQAVIDGRLNIDQVIIARMFRGVEEENLQGFSVDAFGVIDVEANLTERRKEYRQFMNSRD